MDQFQAMTGLMMVIQFVTPMGYVLCLYFILTFFQAWRANDEERLQKAKKGAVLTLAIALLVPAFIGVSFMWR